MGLFDSVVGAVMNEVAQQGGMASALGGLLANDGEHGGLDALVAKFSQAGLGDVVNSWIGHGANLPISADQLSGVLGSDAVGAIASRLGVDPAQASGQLAQLLPGLIDRLTPHGALPAGGLGNADELMGMLGGLLNR